MHENTNVIRTIWANLWDTWTHFVSIGCAISIWLMEILNNFDNSQKNSESFFFIKLTLLEFISTSFRKQYRLSDRRYWWDKSELFFWHFPSHWPASWAISLPFRLECCFWALIWYLACWHKLDSSKIPTKRISVESNTEIFSLNLNQSKSTEYQWNLTDSNS